MGTWHSGLLFKSTFDSNDEGLIGFVDSLYDNEMEWKFVDGFIHFFNRTSVFWRSKKQSTVSKSSTLAEFKELSDTIDKILWLKKLVIEMELLNKRKMSGKAFELKIDSNNAELIVKGTRYNPSFKTVDIAYYLARDYVRKWMVKLSLIDTKDNVADGMTKALGPVAFAKFVKGLRMVQDTWFIMNESHWFAGYCALWNDIWKGWGKLIASLFEVLAAGSDEHVGPEALRAELSHFSLMSLA